MNKKEGFRIDEFIERYKFVIGAFLIIIILAGLGYNVYRENYPKKSLDNRIAVMESKIMFLESRMEEFDQKIQETPLRQNSAGQANPNVQNSNFQTSKQGQVAGAQSSSASQSPPMAGSRQNAGQVSGKININTANASQLDSLPGIGPAIAQSIIEYRGSNGGFKSIEEIKNVPRIGDKTFEKFKDKISI